MITGSRSQYQVSHTRHDVTHTPLSLFRGSYDPTPADTRSLAQVLSAIASDTYAHQITWLRNTLYRHGKGIYDHYKKLLDAVTFGGTFAPTRAKHHLTQPSGLVHLDYDGVHDVAGVKQVLCGGDTVAYSFVSPSGQGLKVGVHVGQVADDGAYKHAWQVVADHFERQYGIIADQSGKDVSRLCFVSWDPEAYVHFDAEVFRVATMITPPPPPIGTRQTPPPGNRRKQYLRDTITRAVSLIASSRPPTRNRPGTRHRNRLRAARLLGGYVAGGFCTYDEAYAILADAVRQHTAHFDRSMKTIADGLHNGMQAPVTFENLEQERLAWCAANGYTPAKSEGK